MEGELEQLGERIAEQAAHVDAAMHRLLTDLREFDQRGGWYCQGAMSCAHWLAWRVGWDLVTARDRVRVACKLADFPAIDDALRRGELSYSKVRALVRVATPANERLLLDHARLMTASQLEKLSRKYARVQRHGQEPHPMDDQQRRFVRRRDTEDGMVKIEAVLHPEEAELVWTMLDHVAAKRAQAADHLRRTEACAAQARRNLRLSGLHELDVSRGAPRQALGGRRRDQPAECRIALQSPSSVCARAWICYRARPGPATTVPRPPRSTGGRSAAVLHSGRSRLATDPRGERGARDRRGDDRL